MDCGTFQTNEHFFNLKEEVFKKPDQSLLDSDLLFSQIVIENDVLETSI